jgi:hypothetical protein
MPLVLLVAVPPVFRLELLLVVRREPLELGQKAFAQSPVA